MRYSQITKADVANGPGVRTTLWVSGCNHCCVGCHNMSSWDKNQGKVFDVEAQNIILSMLEKPYIKGLTLSGGDPLYAYDESLENFLKFIKQLYPEKDIWVWTGYLYEHVQNLSIMQYIDVLVDGPFEIDKRDLTLAWRGSSNQRIIDVKQSREKGKPILLTY